MPYPRMCYFCKDMTLGFSNGERISCAILTCIFVGFEIWSIAGYVTDDKFPKRQKDRV